MDSRLVSRVGLLLMMWRTPSTTRNEKLIPDTTLFRASRDMVVRSVTPPGAMGKVFGFVSTGFSIGGIVSPLLFGYLLDHGQPSLVFQVVAAFMVVSLVTVFTAVGRPREAAPAN